jgi:phage terminase large subunit
MEYRGKQVKCKNFVALTYNPVGRTNWTFKTFFEQTQPDVYIHKSTYKDNPFLGEREINNIEKMRILNPDYYEIYGKGNYGLLKGQVYTNFEIIKPIGYHWDEIIYGVDFGFNNPMALIKIGIYDQEFYIIDEWYKTHQTTGDLINQMKNMKMSYNAAIYADSAEPDRIEEIKRAGFNIWPAWKGKNSVKDGIDKLKQIKLKIWNRCYNTIQEINSYKWKEDKDGNTLEEPEKSNDHLMDAIRYAITSYLGTDNTIYIAPTQDNLANKFKGFMK